MHRTRRTQPVSCAVQRAAWDTRMADPSENERAEAAPAVGGVVPEGFFDDAGALTPPPPPLGPGSLGAWRRCLSRCIVAMSLPLGVTAPAGASRAPCALERRWRRCGALMHHAHLSMDSATHAGVPDALLPYIIRVGTNVQRITGEKTTCGHANVRHATHVCTLPCPETPRSVIADAKARGVEPPKADASDELALFKSARACAVRSRRNQTRGARARRGVSTSAGSGGLDGSWGARRLSSHGCTLWAFARLSRRTSSC